MKHNGIEYKETKGIGEIISFNGGAIGGELMKFPSGLFLYKKRSKWGKFEELAQLVQEDQRKAYVEAKQFIETYEKQRPELK